MKFVQIPVLLVCALLSACGDNGGLEQPKNSIVTASALIDALPHISAEEPFILQEADQVAITEASIDIYESIDYSCSKPRDAKILEPKADLQQKTLLCVEFTIAYSSSRELSISKKIDFPASIADYSDSAKATAEGDITKISTLVTVFASSELMGSLPQNFIASIGVLDIQGNLVTLSAAPLAVEGNSNFG